MRGLKWLAKIVVALINPLGAIGTILLYFETSRHLPAWLGGLQMVDPALLSMLVKLCIFIVLGYLLWSMYGYGVELSIWKRAQGRRIHEEFEIKFQSLAKETKDAWKTAQEVVDGCHGAFERRVSRLEGSIPIKGPDK